MHLIKDILKGVLYWSGSLLLIAFLIVVLFYITSNMGGMKGVSVVDIQMQATCILPAPLIASGLLGLIWLFEKK